MSYLEIKKSLVKPNEALKQTEDKEGMEMQAGNIHRLFHSINNHLDLPLSIIF